MSANGHAEQQTLPAPAQAQQPAAIDQIAARQKSLLQELHATMFRNLDVRKEYIDTLKADLDTRYTAIINAIDAYSEYVKLAGERMDRHDEAMEQISSNAGVVGLETVAGAVENGVA